MKQVTKDCNSEVSGERETTFFVEDLEGLSASVLYTGEPCGSFAPAFASLDRVAEFKLDIPRPSELNEMPIQSPNPIGLTSSFTKNKTPGMINDNIDLGQYFREAKGIVLEQRYDASWHPNPDGGASEFHLNQNLLQANGNRFKERINTGLGEAHRIDLCKLKEYIALSSLIDE